jgi:hypothetical protein
VSKKIVALEVNGVWTVDFTADLTTPITRTDLQRLSRTLDLKLRIYHRDLRLRYALDAKTKVESDAKAVLKPCLTKTIPVVTTKG